jgi:hypothetical protein
LTKQIIKKLEPFFYRKSARQRVILYLVAEGYTIPSLVSMTVKQLEAIVMPPEIAVYRDQVAETAVNEFAFTYPNGRRLLHNDYYTLIRRTTEVVTGKPLAQNAFREYLKNK